MWLRSPGDGSGSTGILSGNYEPEPYGRVFQFLNGNNPAENGLVYPAVWVHNSIFNTN
jgi:hypothetical protein